MKIGDILTLNDTFEPRFWHDYLLDHQVKSKLLEIANDFFNDLDLKDVQIEDITLTGSLANYNWTKYSDIDLHLIIDFSKIDENYDLVRNFFNAKTSNWNKNHKILIFGYEVELYVQHSDDEHFSTGVYSIKNDDWIAKPKRESPEIDASMVERKVKSFVDMIYRAEDMMDDKNFEDAHEFSLKLSEKIRKFRKSGLEKEGQYSNENLAFKYLRNNEYIKLLYGVRNKSYDKMMSMNGEYGKKFKIFLSQEPEKEEKGFVRLNELEKYQKRLSKRHPSMKNRLIGLENQKNVTPFTKKPNYKRSKSSPPGFGGS